MLKPIGMTEGHYECRSLDETLPIFTELLAAEVIERTEKQAVVKHPNTAWRLVIHEGGPDSKNKPHTNHYGFRVATSKEIPNCARIYFRTQSPIQDQERHAAARSAFCLFDLFQRTRRQRFGARVLQSGGDQTGPAHRRAALDDADCRKKNFPAKATCPRR